MKTKVILAAALLLLSLASMSAATVSAKRETVLLSYVETTSLYDVYGDWVFSSDPVVIENVEYVKVGRSIFRDEYYYWDWGPPLSDLKSTLVIITPKGKFSCKTHFYQGIPGFSGWFIHAIRGEVEVNIDEGTMSGWTKQYIYFKPDDEYQFLPEPNEPIGNSGWYYLGYWYNEISEP